MSSKRYSLVALFIGLFVFLTDFFTKLWTENNLPLMYGKYFPYGGIGIFKDFFGVEFSIVHAINKGAAWGMFADFQIYLIILRIFLIIALLVYLIFFNKHARQIIPLTLITFGALGNIVDYFLYGHVIDMFHFVLWGYDFPVFNVADSAICVGIFWLLLASFLEQKPEHNNI